MIRRNAEGQVVRVVVIEQEEAVDVEALRGELGSLNEQIEGAQAQIESLISRRDVVVADLEEIENIEPAPVVEEASEEVSEEMGDESQPEDQPEQV